MRGVRYIVDEGLHALRLLKSRNAITFVICFVISAFFWAFKTLSRTYETEIVVPIHNNIPASLSVSPPPPKNIRVKVRGSGIALFLRYFSQPLFPINLNPRINKLDRDGVFTIDDEGLFSLISLSLSNSKLKVISLIPSQISYSYSPKAKKEMPIILKCQLHPVSDVMIRHVSLIPDNALAYGDRKALDSLQVVRTDTTSLSNIHSDTTMRVRLIAPMMASLIPDSVDVKIETEMLVEQSFDIPIKAIVKDPRYRLLTFPTSVRVTCWVPQSKVAILNPSEILAKVETDGPTENLDKLRIDVYDFPNYINRIQYSPADVEYLLEKIRP